jgi:hypothetical protein
VKDGMSKSTQAVAKLQPSGWRFGVSVGSFWEPVWTSPKEAFGLECPAQHVLKDCTLPIA